MKRIALMFPTGSESHKVSFQNHTSESFDQNSASSADVLVFKGHTVVLSYTRSALDCLGCENSD